MYYSDNIRKILDASHSEVSNTISVVVQYPSQAVFGNGAPIPDKVIKTTYGVVDGKIAIIDIQEGTHHPAQLIPEYVEFPK